ncbi:MAG: tripartite tricarboxylate transporter TctB family protein [Thermodesulfobacteriota bacterium]
MLELRSGFFFLGLSIFVLWESLRLGLGTPKVPGAGFLSFCVGLVLSVLSVVLIVRGWGVRDPLESHSPRVILALACLFAYSLLLDQIGFIVATFFLVGILFRLGEPRRWWALLGMSALVTFLAYLVFGILLHVYFPRSFLGI